MELNYGNYINILTNVIKGIDELDNAFMVYQELKKCIDFKIEHFNEIHLERDDILDTLKFVKEQLSTLRECTKFYTDNRLKRVENQIDDYILENKEMKRQGIGEIRGR